MTDRMVTCAECGEYRRAGSRGLCSRCYNYRQKNGLEMPPKVQVRATCTVPDCGLLATARRLCGTHSSRWRTHGDPFALPRSEPVVSLPGERWRAVPNQADYEVSDHGRVRSLDRVVRNGRGFRPVAGALLSCTTGKRGYPVVKFYPGGTVCVHTLVLTTFVEPRPDGADARHLDGNPLNNRLDNLAWGTRIENVADMARHGRNACTNTERCPREHRLVLPNLVPRQLRRGRRDCRACALARSTVRHARVRHGVEIDFRAEADRRYAAIMGVAA